MAETNPDYAGPEGNKYRQEAQAYAEKRTQFYTESTAQFEAGNKAKAKELSDQGKLAGQKMEESNKKAAEVILAYRNNGHPDTYLDLHGLYLEEALTAFHEKLEYLQNKNSNEEIIFEVIPGAGNHSKNNKAIIKPKIIEEIQKRKLTFEEKNAGTLLVHLPPNKSGKQSETKKPTSTTSSSTPSRSDEARSTEVDTSAASPSPIFGCCVVM